MDLPHYFTAGICSQTAHSVGAEVETQFVYQDGRPVSVKTTQRMLRYLAEHGWMVEEKKGPLITALIDTAGNRVLFELGRHNIEVATRPVAPTKVVAEAHHCLSAVYKAAEKCGAVPFFGPVIMTDEDLLVVPDDRDAVWLELDGREALNLLATTSSVQFTFSLAPRDAIAALNRLGKARERFLADYPQDDVWKRYITLSRAPYREDRYGGPRCFDDLHDYCRQLTRHDVVDGARLVPFGKAESLKPDMYIRSVWWHNRLKRFGSDLCVEVRPLPRRSDGAIADQFTSVRELI